MGRAIDMENDIQKLKVKVDKLENIVRGMTHSMGEMSEKTTKTTHVDLVEDVKTEDKIEEKVDGKKKADNKGTSQRSSDSGKGNGNSKKKNNESGDGSK